MTATTAPSRAWGNEDGRLRRLLAGPAEGWLTLVGVALMVVAVAWSIDDARWVRGIGSLTDSLATIGLIGVAVGFIGPKLGWGRWTTHLLGVAFASIVIPIIAGGIVLGDSVTGIGPVALAQRYRESAEVIYKVWYDLSWRLLPFTDQYGHYIMVFGAIVWATGQFAAFAVFGHRRALDAVIVTGLVLLANMALTQNDQLHLMVLFSLAALVLLARTHAFDERLTWLRRRIGDPQAVTSLYLRGGAVFIAAAVFGSLVLTASASSAPLQGLWKDLPNTLVTISQSLQKYLPLGGASRNPGVVSFGPDAPIVGAWSSNNDVAFRVQLPAAELDKFYWRAGSYAEFNLQAWSWGKTHEFDVASGEDLLKGQADDPVDLKGRREVTFTITFDRAHSNYIFSPDSIVSVDRDSSLSTIGSEGWFAGVGYDGSNQYTATALVADSADTNAPGVPNANRLRVASKIYEAEIQRLYLDVPAGSLGPSSTALLATIMAKVPANNPYDIAKTMETYLRSSAFEYDTNIQDQISDSCQGLSVVECFARIHRGYCQYYASTMAILLRKQGIPTRLAQGYLPGVRNSDGLEIVRNAGAHAWVEVYFPGYGWIPFDPTGGNVAQLVSLPSGPPETPTPRPSFNRVTDLPESQGPRDPRKTPGAPVTGNPKPGGPAAGPFVAIGGLLIVAVLALAAIAWRRGPRPMHPDRAWGSIGRLAARFGLGPRPSQTVYEFAGALAEAIPIVRPELSTVANAKVEIAYANRELGAERFQAVAEAHRTLRLRLLRLAFRRRPRRVQGRGR